MVGYITPEFVTGRIYRIAVDLEITLRLLAKSRYVGRSRQTVRHCHVVGDNPSDLAHDTATVILRRLSEAESDRWFVTSIEVSFVSTDGRRVRQNFRRKAEGVEQFHQRASSGVSKFILSRFNDRRLVVAHQEESAQPRSTRGAAAMLALQSLFGYLAISRYKPSRRRQPTRGNGKRH